MAILAGYSPTKMALLELKNKHKRAKKGHKLLNDKQEGLMAAFMEIIREAQKLRKEAEENPKYDNDKAIYLFNLNKRYDLDGDFKFNTARLINHSCNPNCEVTGTGLKVWVHAIKDIKKGDEFSYDYGFSFDEDYKNYPCRCKSKNCCGYIVREGSRWRIKKKKK